MLSVQFLDADNGWAAGGRTQPYTHRTSGVLLTTHDGGQHWTEIKKLLLPALRGVRFGTLQQGWAFGVASALYPCGIFFTNDGGRDWTPLPTPDAIDCSAAGFFDATGGAVATRDGALIAIGRRQTRPAAAPPLGMTAPRRIQFSGPNAGWLVGDGGLLLSTSDGGQIWRAPSMQIDPRILRQFDFRAISVRGPNIWIAGSPGTQVFHSPDGGRSWSSYPTGQTVPIEAIAFVDDRHGWMAGALGTIQATDDGGQTWQRQRAGAERVGLMAIFSGPDDVPLEMLARQSAAEGCVSVVEVFNRRDVENHSPSSISLPDRTQEAMVALGAQGSEWAWQFPLRQPGLELPARQTTAVWDQVVDGDGLAELDARLVREIRAWRPTVVVTCDAPATDASPARRILQRAVLQAIGHAADPAFDSAPLRVAANRDGTSTWQVQRLFALLPSGQIGSVNINANQWSPRLGRSLAELTWSPRGLLLDDFSAPPDMASFHLLQSRQTDDATAGDFFAGLNLRIGEARREMGQPSVDGLNALRRSALQRRNLQAVLKATAGRAASARLVGRRDQPHRRHGGFKRR